MVLLSAALLAGCGNSPPTLLGPEPLRTPNGEPNGEGLHGTAIPSDIWYHGHAYSNAGIIAHLKGGGHPVPSFLTPAGLARWAYSDSRGGSLKPMAWSSAFPAYERIGIPAEDAIVADFSLIGDHGSYTLYYRFKRE
jgi:hypothetical protein